MTNRIIQLSKAQVGGAICAAALIAIGAGFSAVTFTSMGIEHSQAEAETPEVASTEHVHSWQRNTELVHHDAETHEEYHDAVYQIADVEHTVCNTCGAIIDGQTAQHAENTGHEAYTTGVPVPERQLVSAAWTETVVDAEAYDELVSSTETCTECGETRVIEDDEN